MLVAAQLQNLYILPAGLQAVNYLPGLKEKVTAWDPGAQGSCVAESFQLNISASFRFPVCLLSTGIGSIVELQPSLLFPLKSPYRDFPGGAVVENLPANAGDTGSSPGPGRPHMPRSN